MESDELREIVLSEYDKQYVRGEIDFLEYERKRNELFPDE